MRVLPVLGFALGHGAGALKVGPHALSPTELKAAVEFHEYHQMHERNYLPGTEEYLKRKELFDRRVAEVAEHNSKPDRMWTASINHLTDRTEEELEKLRGYSRHNRPEESSSARAQLLAKATSTISLSDLPTDFSWKNLRATNKIMDQQECGSCWALASATVIRAFSEIYLNEDRTCSVEQILSCTPNPGKCGGSGGCGGATTELAMEYVLQNGCQNSSSWPYRARNEACPAAHKARDSKAEVWKGLGTLLTKTGERDSGAGVGSTSFGMLGYRKLPENKLLPLMQAVYQQGPVAVTVAAGNAWNMYHSGVMNSCHRDAVISHAVTLLGFGEAKVRRNKSQLYWLIQNSWGKRWGEQGTIRLQRHSNEEEEKWCGWDRNPGAGSGCQGGPSKIWVCGSCGILYDNVVPVFAQRDPAWPGKVWARQARESKLSRVEVGPGEMR